MSIEINSGAKETANAKHLANISYLAITAIMIFMTSASSVAFADSWWNVSWQYRVCDAVTMSENILDLQYNFIYNTSNVGANWNWSDNRSLRYTGFYPNGTEDISHYLSYWIESWNFSSPANGNASVWVKVNFTTTNGTQICRYYGNPDANSVSDRAKTDTVYDNFDDNSLSSMWALSSNAWTNYNETSNTLDTGATDATGGNFWQGWQRANVFNIGNSTEKYLVTATGWNRVMTPGTSYYIALIESSNVFYGAEVGHWSGTGPYDGRGIYGDKDGAGVAANRCQDTIDTYNQTSNVDTTWATDRIKWTLKFDGTLLTVTQNKSADEWKLATNFTAGRNISLELSNCERTSSQDAGYKQVFDEVSVRKYTDLPTFVSYGTEQINTTAPTITLSSPVDLSWSKSKTIDYQFTPVSGTAMGFSSCSIWTNATGIWALNKTNTSAIIDGSINTISITHGADGNVLWAVQCTDNATVPLSNFSATNRTIMIDSAAPVVAIQVPTNNAAVNVPYISGIIAETNLHTIRTNDTHYSTLSTVSPFNFTNTSMLAEGKYTINVSANDSAGNIGEAIVTFIYDITPPLLLSYSPSIGAVGINTNTTINITFSEDMNQSTFGGVTLKNSNGTGISMDLQSYNNTTYVAVFKPSASLDSNTAYTINLTGLADLAGNLLQSRLWSFTTATSYNITLSKNGANGWNLISLPVVPVNTNIESVLSSVMSDIITVWTYNSITGNWSMYAPDDPSSTLAQMNAGYGYWINYNNSVSKSITGSGNALIEGANTPPSRTLMPGWNLIGYYLRENTNTVAEKCALFTLTPNINDETAKWWSLMFGYDNQNKQLTQIGYTASMISGQGYWIFMTSRLETYLYGPGLSSSECV